MARSILGLLLVLAVAAAQATPLEVWLTTGDRSRLLAREPDLAPAAAPLPRHIQVDGERRFQRLVGFGAAITDASAWLLRNRMSPAQSEALLQEFFGPPPGLGFAMARITIGGSEYALRHYSFDDQPPGSSDPALAGFSIEPHRIDMLPVLRQARAINPELRLVATPWSAPGWMKTSDSLIGGSLRPEAFGAYADYLLRFVDAYRAAGVPIYALTLQNEPHFEPRDYPGMRLEPPARARLAAEHLGPRLAARGGPLLLDWDHNWEEPESPLAVLAEPAARPYVAGVAWHCYKGDEAAQSQVHDAHPDKDVYFTECASGGWDPDWANSLVWVAGRVIVGATRHWARGVIFWNLALDESHGPHRGGCPDCQGMVTVDSASGRVTRNHEYYAFAHASRFVRPGAWRIASSEGGDGLSNVAFRNEDGSRVLIVVNSSRQPRRYSVDLAGERYRHQLPARSVATLVWRPTPGT